MSTTPRPVNPETPASGWATFVGAYLAVAGVLNAIWGIAALANKDYFRSDGLLWSALDTWGWIGIVVGCLQVLGAVLIASRKSGGAIIALLLAFLGVLFNFLSIGAYPVWSCILLGFDALIIWAVTVHGEEFVR